MIQYRRLAALLLGIWLGASILADVAVTQNFQTVDRFLQTPDSVSTSAALHDIPRDRMRFILRRNAAEENNWIFVNWERAEVVLGCLLFLLLLFGERPQIMLMALCAAMILIVGVEHFALTPTITDLGRRVDDLPVTDPGYKRFWLMHGLYSGLDILKMLMMAAFAARLVIKRKPDPNYFAKEFEASMPAGVNMKAANARSGSLRG